MYRFFVFTVSIFVCFSVYAQFPSNGLVAWYPFNGNAIDESGNAFNGSPIGATLTNDRFGEPDKAYRFNGTTSYIRLNNNNPVITSTEFTIAGWAYMEGPPGGPNHEGGIFEQRDDNSNTQTTKSTILFMTEDANHNTHFLLRSDINYGGTIIHLTSPSPGYGSWHFYVGSLGSDDTMRLFIDAIQVAKTQFTQPGVFANSVDHVDIGSHQHTGNSFRGLFNGIVDDLKIYNRALTPEEIVTLYNELPCNLTLPIVSDVFQCGIGSASLSATGGSNFEWYSQASLTSLIYTGPVFTTPILTENDTFWVRRAENYCYSDFARVIVYVSLAHISQNDTSLCAGSTMDISIDGYNNPIIPDGLVAFYPFNNNALDESKYTHDGVLSGEQIIEDRFGNPNKAYRFNGASNYIKLNNELPIITTTAFTVSAWARTNGLSGGLDHQGAIFEQRDDNATSYGNSTIVFIPKNGQSNLEFQVRSDQSTCPLITLTYPAVENGTYHLYTGLIGSDDTVRVFIDTIEVVKQKFGYSGSFSTSIDHVDIGSHRHSGNDIRGLFNGDIDDVRIYNRPLNRQEICALFNETLQPGSYTFTWSTGDTTPYISISPIQSNQYFVTVSNENNACTDSIAVLVKGSSICGTVSYANSINTPITCAAVYIKNPDGVVVDSTITDIHGNYQFCDLAYGSYSIHVASTQPWGGVNTIDALTIAKHFTLITQLTGLHLLAADVVLSGYINSVDALVIQKRFVGLMSSFSIPDWIFEPQFIQITGSNPQVVNIKGVCAGDVNGSYIPAICD